MAASITTSSSVQPKPNINTAIANSSWANSASGTKIQQVSLTQLQQAIAKLSTYIKKVNNCGNCYNYTIKSTSCQSTKVTTTCQSTSCQSASCQSQACQSCQGCQSCQSQCRYQCTSHCDSM